MTEPARSTELAAPLLSRAAFVVAGSLALASCQSGATQSQPYGQPPHIGPPQGDEQPIGPPASDAGVEAADSAPVVANEERDRPVYGAPPPRR